MYTKKNYNKKIVALFDIFDERKCLLFFKTRIRAYIHTHAATAAATTTTKTKNLI
jgi:hypothetical protein